MSVTLLLGPMYAGKSSELLRRFRRYQIANKQCFLIKYIKDNRYDQNGDRISTHDEYHTPCDYATEGKLLTNIDLNTKIKNVDVICIDEGQFFDDIDEFADFYANQGKIIIISALDSDFRRQPFAKISNLIAMAEDYIKFTAICRCGKDACYTKRISEETESIVIGGKNKYVSLCRSCYNQN